MTPRDAFVQAIVENPQDDSVRIIFADWLEDNGEGARAEFIRVQCELGRDPDRERVCRETCEPPNFHGCPQKDLRRRQWELLGPPGEPNTNNLRWLEEFWDRVGCDSSLIVQGFRRGFVSSIICSAADWLQHADAITAITPLEEVTLTNLPRWDEMLHFLKQQGRLAQKVNDLDNDFSDPIIAWRIFSEQFFPRIEFTLPPAHRGRAVRLDASGRVYPSGE